VPAEPLPVATTVSEILPGVFRWAAFSPHHKVELASHAVWDGRTLLVFDPIPLAAEVFDWFPVPHAPDAIVLTNENHERDARHWRELFPLAVWAAPEAQCALAGVRWLAEGPAPFPGWEVFFLPGGAGGETAWLCSGLSLMVFGDAVVNLPERGLELLPAKYCRDPAELRRSLANLPPFERAVFAHGQPLVSAASERIAALL
jgi:glyoxylase-like metal-dependent hydrolase (beta-lactamase superfamily II)